MSKEGLTVTDTTAEWAGQKNDGTYYANDKTGWVDVAPTLTNQPVIVMLPNTGVAITPTTIAILGLGLVAVGVTVATVGITRRRHTGTGSGEGR